MNLLKNLLAVTFVSLAAGNFLPAMAKSNNIARQDTVTVEKLQEKLDKQPQVTSDLIEQVVELVKRSPDNARAHYLLANVYKRAGYDDLAEQEYRKSDELSPGQPDALLDLFTAKLQQNDFAGAGKYFTYLQRRFPGNPAVIVMRGAFISEKHPQVADKMFDQAISLSPAGSGIRTTIAMFRLRWGRPQESLQLALQDLAKSPDRYQSSAIAGKSLVALGRSAEAVPYLSKAYEANYADSDIADVYAHALINAGHNLVAIEPALVNMALQTDYEKMAKSKVAVRSLLGSMPRDEFVNCLQLADLKLDRTPYQFRLHLAMGDVCDTVRLTALAINEYKKGIALDSTYVRGYYRLAVDMDQSGKYKEALEYYTKAFRLDPSSPQIKNGFYRLLARLNNRQNDLAWRSKDWLKGAQ